MKVRFHTLGCKLNFAETSTFHRQLLEKGFEEASPSSAADILIINTCSVTADADKKCRNIIRRLIKDNPGAITVITGCYASLSKKEIETIPGVSLVLSNDEKSSLTECVEALAKGAAPDPYKSYFGAFSSGDRTRSFLKVQDGCSYRCSYCTIPAARGESRNMSIASVVEDARKVASLGQKEIVLTGVNIGDFGKSTGESFLDLLLVLDSVDGIERYRISSIEPNLLTDEIIDFTASSRKFMPHFHIPLQSGSNSVLQKMHRRYRREKFADRIAKVREKMADAFFGVDVIVGFPTESEQNFQETYDFLSEVRPSFLHVFPFSSRPGTEAASMAQIPFCEKECRVHTLTSLSNSLHNEFQTRFLGTTRPVLLESEERGGMMSGFTDNYLRVQVPFESSLIGTIVPVNLVSLSGQSIGGTLLQPCQVPELSHQG